MDVFKNIKSLSFFISKNAVKIELHFINMNHNDMVKTFQIGILVKILQMNYSIMASKCQKKFY
mgnify:CR=1 FL=1